MATSCIAAAGDGPGRPPPTSPSLEQSGRVLAGLRRRPGTIRRALCSPWPTARRGKLARARGGVFQQRLGYWPIFKAVERVFQNVEGPGSRGANEENNPQLFDEMSAHHSRQRRRPPRGSRSARPAIDRSLGPAYVTSVIPTGQALGEAGRAGPALERTAPPTRAHPTPCLARGPRGRRLGLRSLL